MNSADGTGRQVRRRLTRTGTTELGRGCHENSRGERTVFLTNVLEHVAVLTERRTGRWARRSTALRRAGGGREKQSPPRGEAREPRGCPGPLSSFPKSTPPGQARGTHLTNLAWGTFYRCSGTKQGEWEPLRDQGRPGRPSDERAVGCAAAGMPERERDLRREAGEIRIKNGVYFITT